VGNLVIGWRLLVAAETALAALQSESIGVADKAFYEGKIGVASFFAKNVLPALSSDWAIISALDNDLMELDEAAF